MRLSYGSLNDVPGVEKYSLLFSRALMVWSEIGRYLHNVLDSSAIILLLSNSSMVFGIVLSYPLAYMVTNGNSDCGVVDLGQYTTTDIDEEVEIEINTETMYIKDTSILKDFNWPINVGDDQNADALLVVGDNTFQEDSRLGLRR